MSDAYKSIRTPQEATYSTTSLLPTEASPVLNVSMLFTEFGTAFFVHRYSINQQQLPKFVSHNLHWTIKKAPNKMFH